MYVLCMCVYIYIWHDILITTKAVIHFVQAWIVFEMGPASKLNEAVNGGQK